VRFDDALQAVRSGFRAADESLPTLESERWLELLDALVDRGLQGLRGELAVHKFLYHGALHFDRWAAPTPVVVRPDDEPAFGRFLDALTDLEGHRSDNVLPLRVHRLRSELFRCHAHLYNQVPEPASRAVLQRYLTSAAQLPVPAHPAKRLEFEQSRDDLERILRGLLDGSLRSVLATCLPYALCLRPMRVVSTWQGLGIEIRLTPSFQCAEGISAGPNAIAQPIGSTRWQAGTTDVQIEFDGLLDADMWTPALRATPSIGAEPLDGWPNAFTTCFSVVHDLFWQIRTESGVHAAWPPSPRDVSTVTSYLATAGARRVGFKTKHLGAIQTVVNPERSLIDVAIPEIVPPAHWARCRETAVSYLALGDTREALLFLNMAVESLLDVRFRQLAETLGEPDALETVLSTKALWKDAQDLVAKHAPEAAAKIPWPDTQVHQSRFAQIKLAHQLLAPRSSYKDVKSRYSAVARGRNELVHGSEDRLVPVARVVEALGAFDWLVENFVPRGRPDAPPA